MAEAAPSTYELVEMQSIANEKSLHPREFDDGFESPSSCTIDGKHTSRLPPRPLRPKRPLWPFGVSFVAAITTFLGCLILLKFLGNLKPENASGQSIIYWDNAVSCDLATRNGTAVQNAFLFDLRSPLELSFMEAKLIDIVWDLFVGQGGRFLMAWISYRVFMDSLVALMEKSAINYDVYTSIAFSTTSLWALQECLKGLFRLTGMRTKMFMLWFALAVTYVLAFPTLMAAATGYVNPSTASYKMSEGRYIDVDSIQFVECLNVTQGHLIGLKDNDIITGPPLNQGFYSYDDGYYRPYSTSEVLRNSTFNETHSDWVQLSSPANKTGVFYEVTDLKTKEKSNATAEQLAERYHQLDLQRYYQPGVTICSDGIPFCGPGQSCQDALPFSSILRANDCTEAHRHVRYDDLNGGVSDSVYPVAEISLTWYSNITFRNHTYTFQNLAFRADQRYSVSNKPSQTTSAAMTENTCTSDGSVIPDSVDTIARCMPKSYFVWGFSSLLLYIILPLQMVWIAGMFLLWLHANMTSELLLAQRTGHGTLRAVADLAEAIREVLGDEFCNYQNGELHKELGSEGGNLRFYTRHAEEDEVGHIGMTSLEDRALELNKAKLYGAVGKVKRRKR